MATQPIFEICVHEMGYEVGVRQRATWWRQTAAYAKLRTTLKEKCMQQGSGGNMNNAGVTGARISRTRGVMNKSGDRERRRIP